MSIISEKPKVGIYEEVLYEINIYEKNGKLKIELDENGNIKTNINRLISSIITYKKEGKIVEIDHDLYTRLNNGIDPIKGEIKEEIAIIVHSLYYSEKKLFHFGQ